MSGLIPQIYSYSLGKFIPAQLPFWLVSVHPLHEQVLFGTFALLHQFLIHHH
jgi:hypothetical protein